MRNIIFIILTAIMLAGCVVEPGIGPIYGPHYGYGYYEHGYGYSHHGWR